MKFLMDGRGGSRTAPAIFGVIIVFLSVVSELCAISAGTTSADFLLVDYSAKSSAMGNSYVGCGYHPDAMMINPGGLGFARQNMFTASHMEYFGEMRYEYLAITHKLYEDWNWGANIVYRGSDEISRDNRGRDIGEFKNRDLFVTFGAGYLINKNFSLGVTGKLIHQRLFDRNGWTFALDGGLHLEKSWRQWKFIGGMSLLNVGPDISYGGADGPLPIAWQVSFGVKYQFKKQYILVTQDSRIIRGNEPDFALGIEYRPADYFAARLGFVGGADMTDFNAPRLGFSFYQKYGTFDYSFRRLRGLDDIHQISYTIPFGKGRWFTEMD